MRERASGAAVVRGLFERTGAGASEAAPAAIEGGGTGAGGDSHGVDFLLRRGAGGAAGGQPGRRGGRIGDEVNGGPVTVLEDAVHLLREGGVAALTLHWTGSVPMALGALAFRNSLANPRLSNAALAISALGMALLLVWMNAWRGVFARTLRARLSGA